MHLKQALRNRGQAGNETDRELAKFVASERAAERNRKVFLSIVSALGSKATSAISLAVVTPLALHSLGKERFGLWLTLASLTTVMGFIDLGLGNGFLNIVSHSNGKNDQSSVRAAFANGFAMLCVIALVFAACYFAASPYLNPVDLYGISKPADVLEAKASMNLAALLLAVALPFQLAQKLQQGYQEGYEANLWQISSNLTTLSALTYVAYYKSSIPLLLLASVGIPAFFNALNLLNQFLVVRPWLLPKLGQLNSVEARNLLKLGGIWTISQLAALVGTGADSMIVSKNFGASAVADYAVMARLQALLLMSQILALPLWPAFSEALARGDHGWATRTFNKAVLIFSAIGIVSALVIAFGAEKIISIWISPSVVPDRDMTIAFACWAFIANFFFAISALLANQQTIRAFTYLTCIAAMVSFTLKFALMSDFGATAVVLGSVIGYALICVPGYMLARKMLLKVKLGNDRKTFIQS